MLLWLCQRALGPVGENHQPDELPCAGEAGVGSLASTNRPRSIMGRSVALSSRPVTWRFDGGPSLRSFSGRSVRAFLEGHTLGGFHMQSLKDWSVCLLLCGIVFYAASQGESRSR